MSDGQVRDLEFEVPIARSGWVAARILPSSHTNPDFHDREWRADASATSRRRMVLGGRRPVLDAKLRTRASSRQLLGAR